MNLSFLNDLSFRFILMIIVIIVLSYILFKYRATNRSRRDSLDIMKERLDRGEIAQEDYDEAQRRQGKNKTN